MADTVQTAFANTGATLYFIVRNRAGQVWNTSGSAFEAYNASNWTDYAIAMTEQGASRVYVGDFPALATGPYGVTIYEQAAGTAAVTDDPVWSGGGDWDGDNEQFMSLAEAQASIEAACATVDPDAVAAVILTTPANLLATDASGYVTVAAASVTAIAAGVWGAATRSLTTFGSFADTVAAAVWTYSTRTLSAFSFTVATSLGSAIKAVTDKLDTMLSGSGPYVFTSAALVNTPAGDATEAKQDTIIAALGALNDPDAAAIAAAVLAEEVETGLTLGAALADTRSWAAGKVVRTSAAGANPLVLEFYNQAGDGARFTLTIQRDGSGRTTA